MQDKLIIDRYQVITDNSRLKEVKNLRILSDFHVGRRTLRNKGKRAFAPILEYFDNQSDIDAVLIPGDHVNRASSFVNKDVMNQLCLVLSEIVERVPNTPVILSMGNHDKYRQTPETLEAYKSLGDIKNVYPLDNEKIEFKGVVYAGFSPRHTAYRLLAHGVIANRMTVKDFHASGLTFDPNQLNILLNHAPHLMSNKHALCELKEIYEALTLIVSGHLHNGGISDDFEQNILSKFKWLQDKGRWPSIKTGFVNNMSRGGFVLSDKREFVSFPTRGEEALINLSDERAALLVSKGVNRAYHPPSVTEVTIKPMRLTKKLKTN